MTKQELYENIDLYIAGSLSEEALKDFENQMKNDPNLAEEVKLHQKVHSELGDVTKKELRNILSDVKGKYTQSGKVVQMQPRRFFSRNLAVAASVLILGMAFWFLFLRSPEEEPQFANDSIDPTEEVTPTDSPKDTSPEVIENDPSYLVQSDPEDPPTSPDNNSLQLTEKPDDSPTIDYSKAHPGFDEMVASAGNEALNFEVEAPGPNALLRSRGGLAPFKLLATLMTSEFPKDKDIVLHVFDNQDQSFQDKTAVFETNLIFEKEENPQEPAFGQDDDSEVYYLEFQHNISLQPGTYYWIVSVDGEESGLVGGKFRVRTVE